MKNYFATLLIFALFNSMSMANEKTCSSSLRGLFNIALQPQNSISKPSSMDETLRLVDREYRLKRTFTIKFPDKEVGQANKITHEAIEKISLTMLRSGTAMNPAFINAKNLTYTPRFGDLILYKLEGTEQVGIVRDLAYLDGVASDTAKHREMMITFETADQLYQLPLKISDNQWALGQENLTDLSFLWVPKSWFQVSKETFGKIAELFIDGSLQTDKEIVRQLYENPTPDIYQKVFDLASNRILSLCSETTQVKIRKILQEGYTFKSNKFIFNGSYDLNKKVTAVMPEQFHHTEAESYIKMHELTHVLVNALIEETSRPKRSKLLPRIPRIELIVDSFLDEQAAMAAEFYFISLIPSEVKQKIIKELYQIEDSIIPLTAKKHYKGMLFPNENLTLGQYLENQRISFHRYRLKDFKERHEYEPDGKIANGMKPLQTKLQQYYVYPILFWGLATQATVCNGLEYFEKQDSYEYFKNYICRYYLF